MSYSFISEPEDLERSDSKGADARVDILEVDIIKLIEIQGQMLEKLSDTVPIKVYERRKRNKKEGSKPGDSVNVERG